MKNMIFCVWRGGIWLLCLGSLLFLSGCVCGGASSGRLSHSLDVEQIFTAGTILPDHTYYIQGSAVEPEAIISISNTSQLQSRLWLKVEWTKKELDSAVFWMQDSEVGFCSTDGGNILGVDGKQIGIWFSKRDVSFIKEPSPGVVEVYPFKFQVSSPCRRQYLREQL